MLPLILAALRAVAPHLATDGGGMDVVLPSNGFLAFAFLNSQIDCVSLLAGQLFIHCNTKVIVPGGLRSPFFVLPVDSILRRHADGELHFYCESSKNGKIYTLYLFIIDGDFSLFY